MIESTLVELVVDKAVETKVGRFAAVVSCSGKFCGEEGTLGSYVVEKDNPVVVLVVLLRLVTSVSSNFVVFWDSSDVVAAVIASVTVFSFNREAVETTESSVERLAVDAASKVSTTVEVEKTSRSDSVVSEKARVVDSTAEDIELTAASVTGDSFEDSSVELITSVDVFSSSSSYLPVPNSKSASVDCVLEGASDGLTVEIMVDDEVELTLMYFVSTANVVENGIVEDVTSSADVEITPEDVVTSVERLIFFSVVISVEGFKFHSGMLK